MSDPSSPPAIVQPALFADVLTALLSEAQGFGRKTIEAKVSCGRKLVEAKDEWEKRKDKTPWAKLLKRFGFSQQTAWRLMKAARSHKSASNLDSIYDDGYDADLDEGKSPCRDCRHHGKKFDSKCAGCRSLNREPPKPKDDTPPQDRDGNLIPGHLLEVFREGEIIRSLTEYLATATKALVGLSERPGCSALRVDEIEKRLRSLKTYALNQRPGYVHLECEGKGCSGCRKGFRSIEDILQERAAESSRKKAEKAREYHAKKNVGNSPIPE